jgi:DNA polymerase-3 subunit epsilon
MVMASFKLRKVRHELVDFKQSTVAKFLGIEIDEAKLHDAKYDIQICIKIFNML